MSFPFWALALIGLSQFGRRQTELTHSCDMLRGSVASMALVLHGFH